MDSSITIICALIGDKWPDVWVYRLARMLEAKMTVPYNFRVITDRWEEFPEWGVEFSREIVWTDDHHSQLPSQDPRMILNRGKPQGCWGKLDGFLPSFGSGPRIIIDLDVVIHECLSKLVSDVPAMPEDSPGHFNGSIYSFTGEVPPGAYPTEIPYGLFPRGEQEYAAAILQPKRLEGCYSFKNDIASRYGTHPPDDAVVTFFHGRPTPAHDALQNVPWISETWKGLDREDRR